MTAFPTLLLASTSPHRQALLGRLGAPFASVAPGVDEQERPGETPPQRAARLARAKAAAVARQQPTAIVIGSDQVASLETEAGSLLLHKPGGRANCLRQLRAMSGRTTRFVTALAVMHGETLIEHADTTLVRFRVLSDADIERYMDREPSFDCAGGFKCEGLGVTLFESVETRDPTALIGLPLIALCAALRQLGVAV
jgi:septum formation protein